MTESMPINQGATEQRLMEELTGSPIPPEVPKPGEPVRPGDPEPQEDVKEPASDAG